MDDRSTGGAWKIRLLSGFATIGLLATAAAAQIHAAKAEQVHIAKPAYGEPNGTFPNWQERAVAELTNRARSAPSTDLAACPPGSCSEAACYSPVSPLPWRYELNQAARFHATTMGMFPFFAHDTPCVLFTDIASRYPGSSTGSFASSCSGSGTTFAGTRITYFAGNWSGENIAVGYAGPFDVFYAWLYESTAVATCGFHGTGDNGHRYNILTNGPALGVGYQNVAGSTYGSYWTQDFGLGPVVPRIPSGSHWTSVNHNRDPLPGDTTTEFWANWSDSAGPNTATVVVDGVPQTMTLARGSSTNGAYTFSATGVSTACHSYYFAFTTSTAAAVRYPDTGAFGFGNGTCVDWQNSPPPAVSGVVAAATTSTNVQVSWSGSCATTCNVYRSADRITYTPVGSSATSPFNDMTATGNTSYLYKVRASNGMESADSNTDIATTVIYTDDPLIAGTTTISAAHLTQLRTAVNAVLKLAGLGAASVTNSGAIGTIVSAVDINELRTALDAAAPIVGLPIGAYTDIPLVAGTTTIKAAHFQELRSRMK